MQNDEGFTLIELSIVLVIIGLIVGGVLVGQDLVHAAKLRAATSQIEEYRAATLTFKNKYNDLPGDIANPAAYGLFSNGTATSNNRGDGDKIIEMRNTGASNPYSWSGESAVYWRHLAEEGYIAGNFDVPDYECQVVDPIDDTDLPRFKVGSGRVHITNLNGKNLFTVSAMPQTIASNCYTITNPIDQHALTPLDASKIDTKLDNGHPETGRIRSIIRTYNLSEFGGGSDPYRNDGWLSCYDLGTKEYAVNVDQKWCDLRFDAGF